MTILHTILFTRSARVQFALVGIILLGFVGCSRRPAQEMPKTFPVTGQVVNKSGKPVVDGRIEFVSTVDEKTQAIGVLQPDGTFTLLTAIGKEVLPGAIEGPHKVTLLPGTQGQEPAYFKETCKVVPGHNDFKLVYPY